jgi:molybdenum cofactor biosynthesis enzyme MoaA
MKEKEIDYKKPQFIDVSKLEKAISGIDDFEEVEITGGGDPLLHKDIQEIINLFRGKYVKLYTEGFLLKEISGIDELNLSRVHWNSSINNFFYRSKLQNELDETLNFYRPKVGKIRMQTILIKGAIDSIEKIKEFVTIYENKVDIFMFRELFPACSLEKDKFVGYFDFSHPKVMFDRTLDSYSRDLYFIESDSVVHNDFQY